MLKIAFHHFSFIVMENKIIEYGMNRIHVPPKHFGYDKRMKGWDKGYTPRLHSELDAYRRAKGLIMNHEFEMINIRLCNDGKMLKISCPCNVCQEWLPSVGCKKLAFSVDTGFAYMTF